MVLKEIMAVLLLEQVLEAAVALVLLVLVEHPVLVEMVYQIQ